MDRMIVVSRTCPPHDQMCFHALERPLARLRGLLGTSADAEPVALVGCHAIHTYGMRYRIDVAFVERGGLVLGAWCSVPPGRLLDCKGAWITLERPHSRKRWLARGERVRLEGTDGRWPACEKREERKSEGGVK